MKNKIFFVILFCLFFVDVSFAKDDSYLFFYEYDSWNNRYGPEFNETAIYRDECKKYIDSFMSSWVAKTIKKTDENLKKVTEVEKKINERSKARCRLYASGIKRDDVYLMLEYKFLDTETNLQINYYPFDRNRIILIFYMPFF